MEVQYSSFSVAGFIQSPVLQCTTRCTSTQDEQKENSQVRTSEASFMSASAQKESLVRIEGRYRGPAVTAF